MTKLAIGINLDRCIGCHTCANACKMQNNVPDGMLWNRVITEGCDAIDGAVGEYPNLTRTYVPLACQHCENPACLKVCPTGATYKDEQGRVEIDYDRCIGCRMCMAACPFNARVFNWEDPQRDGDFNWGDARVPVRTRGVMEKCTLCKERTDAGEEPMCVVCCPKMCIRDRIRAMLTLRRSATAPSDIRRANRRIVTLRWQRRRKTLPGARSRANAACRSTSAPIAAAGI